MKKIISLFTVMVIVLCYGVASGEVSIKATFDVTIPANQTAIPASNVDVHKCDSVRLTFETFPDTSSKQVMCALVNDRSGTGNGDFALLGIADSNPTYPNPFAMFPSATVEVTTPPTHISIICNNPDLSSSIEVIGTLYCNRIDH